MTGIWSEAGFRGLPGIKIIIPAGIFQERLTGKKNSGPSENFLEKILDFGMMEEFFFRVAGNIQKNLSELPADHGAPDKPVRIQVLWARPLIQRNYSR